MDNIITRILEIDRKAREETEQAELQRALIEQSVTEKKKIIHEEFLKRAEHRIELLEASEKKMVAESVKESREACAKKMKEFDDIVSKNSSELIDQIVNRVIGG